MGKSKKKKRDFQKVKIRVGRKLTRTNETKIDLTMKQLVVRSQFEDRHLTKDKSQNLLRQLECTRSDDRAKCLQDLLKTLECLFKERQALSSSPDPEAIGQFHVRLQETLPARWLPCFFRRFILDSSFAVVKTTAACVIAFVKLMTCDDGIIDEASLLDVSSDLVRSLLSSSNVQVRWEAVGLIECLLHNLPNLFRPDFRWLDLVLLLTAMDAFTADQVKLESMSRDRSFRLLVVWAGLLRLSTEGTTHPWLINTAPGTRNNLTTNFVDSNFSLKRLQWGLGSHEWTAKHLQGDWSRFSEDEASKGFEFKMDSFLLGCCRWVAKLGTKLLEEDMSSTTLSPLTSLTLICVYIQRILGFSTASNDASGAKFQLPREMVTVVTTLLSHLFPADLSHIKDAESAVVKDSNLHKLNISLVELSLFCSSQSSLLPSNWSTLLSQHLRKLTASSQILSSHRVAMDWLRLSEQITRIPKLQRQTHPLIDLAGAILMMSSNQSKLKRRSVVVLTLSCIQQWKACENTDIFRRPCFKQLLKQLPCLIEKGNQPDNTYYRAHTELALVGVPVAAVQDQSTSATGNSLMDMFPLIKIQGCGNLYRNISAF